MTRFVRPTETVRIYLTEFDGSEDWVDVRAALSWRDSLELRALAIAGATQSQDGVQLQIDPWRAQLELLSRAIVNWSLKYAPDDPAPIPVTRSAIEQLNPQLGDWLAQKIDAMYALDNSPNLTRAV